MAEADVYLDHLRYIDVAIAMADTLAQEFLSMVRQRQGDSRGRFGCTRLRRPCEQLATCYALTAPPSPTRNVRSAV